MQKPSASTPVLVLKLEHYGSLGIMRSLGRIGAPVYGIDANPDAVAVFSRYCRGSYTWDLDRAHPSDTLEYLMLTAKAIGGRPVLIPTSDETATFVATHAWRLREGYRFHDLRADLVTALSNKKEMHRLAVRFGVPTPGSLFPSGRDELIRSLRTLKFPVVLKGIDGPLLREKAGARMVIIRDPDELLEVYSGLAGPEPPNLVVQEYLEGADDSAWLFNGVFNERSECIAAYTGRKLRLNPVYTGMTSYGVCQWNRTIAESAIYFLTAVGYRGIVDIDYRFDPRDGEYKLLDVNPRIGASFRLFVTGDGMDVARALYLDLTGRPVRSGRAPDGRTWIVEDKDLHSSYRYFRDGKLGLSSWLRTLRRIDEAGYYAPDDPAPFGRMWMHHLRRTGTKLRDRRIERLRKKSPEPAERPRRAGIYQGQHAHMAR